MEKKISVMMREVEEHKMFLHEDFGKGTTNGGADFTVVRTVPGGALILEIGGKRWRVDATEIIREMVEAAENAALIASLEKHECVKCGESKPQNEMVGAACRKCL